MSCLARFGGAIIKVTFNTMLKKRAYTRETIEQVAAPLQFRRGDIGLDPIGFELWLRK